MLVLLEAAFLVAVVEVLEDRCRLVVVDPAWVAQVRSLLSPSIPTSSMISS